MFEYNKDVKKRDRLLFCGDYDPKKYFGGIRRVEELTADDIDWLIENKFLDPDECQNDSPSTTEIRDFILEHPQFTAFGYAVSPDRSDYRITLEGIWCNEDVDVETLKDFVEFSKYADELDVRPALRAWWD